jgi:hypothetical protein
VDFLVNGRRDGGGYVAVGGGVSGGECWDVQVAGVGDVIGGGGAC